MFRKRPPESIYSTPNLITLLRLGASLAFFTLALLERNETYNFIGLALHWLGDVADGFVARRFHQETILGAEIDIIADRVEFLFFFINFLFFHPQLYLPIIVYLLDFAFVDFYLSYQFIKFDLISPNYFYKVDKNVYRFNYSPAGKFANSTIVPLLLIFLPRWWIIALVWALGLIGLKLFSFYLLNKKKNIDKNLSSSVKESS
ncbi:MAG TPA: CDP-alcohol phosphatidyltransferase family protein [Candidatus Aminicenantes bacterium]|nr:CDP-alcohol phosphatidyltransferase family protein [Candidatus Aminicenantes bacterium]